MASLSPQLQNLLKYINPLLEHRTIIAATITALLLPGAIRDYRGWLAIGRGGLPHNIAGYILQAVLRPFRVEVLSTSDYDAPKSKAKYGAYADVAFLKEDDLPARDEERPVVGHWTVPQRQLTLRATPEAKNEMKSFFATLAAASSDELYTAVSRWERYGPALFVRDPIPGSIATKCRTEIVHLHEEEGSMHVVLTPKDAKQVIERGWGQKFTLAGVLVPSTYIMVYAPKNDAEVEVVKKIVRAGTDFLLGKEGL